MCPTGRVILTSAACLAPQSLSLVKIAKRSFFTPENDLMGNWTASDRHLLRRGNGKYSPTKSYVLTFIQDNGYVQSTNPTETYCIYNCEILFLFVILSHHISYMLKGIKSFTEPSTSVLPISVHPCVNPTTLGSEDGFLLVYCAVLSGRSVLTFQKCLLELLYTAQQPRRQPPSYLQP